MRLLEFQFDTVGGSVLACVYFTVMPQKHSDRRGDALIRKGYERQHERQYS